MRPEQPDLCMRRDRPWRRCAAAGRSVLPAGQQAAGECHRAGWRPTRRTSSGSARTWSP